MKTASFDSMLAVLANLDPWLMSLGIRPKNDRWHEAIKTLQRAKQRREIVERGGKPAFVKNYLPGLFDALEIYEIVQAFSGTTSAAMKEKVLRASSGPIAPLDEQPANSVARNAMFELSLAAEWKNGSAVVGLGEPDILLHLAGAVFQTECKRPFKENSVWSNIEDGASQLARELDKPGNTAFGIVAVSLSRVFTQGDLVCYAPAGEGRQFVSATLESMIAAHETEWQLRQFLNFHERIVAVMFHLAVPWDVNGERLVHCAVGNAVQAGRSSQGWELLSKNMPKLY